MRVAARARGHGRAREIAIPLPTGGILAEAVTTEASGAYAGELRNWRPTSTSLRLRQQYSITEGGDAALQRLPFEYGAAHEYITVFPDRVTIGNISFDRQFSNPVDVAFISAHAVMVDGSGSPVLFGNGKISSGAFATQTDLSTDEFDGVIAHQDRLFFWKTGDDLDFYYGDVGAITGGLTRFPLGRLGNITGSILCIQSMTVDAGHGMNDTMAVFTTTGQIVIYEGTDPSDPQDWRLLTRISAAPPVSKNAFVKVGSDLWMLTASGVVSVSQTIRDSSLALVSTISRHIQQTLLSQIEQGGHWSMHLMADATGVIISREFDGVASQFIFRTDTKAWFEADYPAKAWHNIGMQTQFTTIDGQIATLNDGHQDQITALWVSGWLRLPRPSGIAFIRPAINVKGPLTIKVSAFSDYNTAGRNTGDIQQIVEFNVDGGDEYASFDGIVAVNAVGQVYQIEMEVTAKWAELVNMKVGIQ